MNSDLRFAVLLQPANDTGGQGVETSYTNGRVEGLEQLVSHSLKLHKGGH